MSKDDLKKKLIFAYRNIKYFNKKMVAKTKQVLKPYVLSALFMLSPSTNFTAVATGSTNNNQKTKDLTEQALHPEDKMLDFAYKDNGLSYMDVPSVEEVDNLEECLAKYGQDIKIDLSQANLSIEELSLAQGKESKLAVKMWNKSLEIVTGAEKCAANGKRVYLFFGLIKNTDKKMVQGFKNVRSAYQLKPYFDNGTVVGYTALGLNEKAKKSKTTPIIVFQIFARGDTEHGHSQFKWLNGVSYGTGIKTSPSGHRTKSGTIQKYGDVDSYVDRGTAEALLGILCKRKEFVAVFDREKGSVILYHKSDLPENKETAKLLNNPDFSQYKQISSSTKNPTGLDNLRAELKKALGEIPAEGVFSARRRHVNAIKETIDALHRSIEMLDLGDLVLCAREIAIAQDHLGTITGKVTSDDILGKIFSTFCIGK